LINIHQFLFALKRDSAYTLKIELRIVFKFGFQVIGDQQLRLKFIALPLDPGRRVQYIAVAGNFPFYDTNFNWIFLS